MQNRRDFIAMTALAYPALLQAREKRLDPLPAAFDAIEKTSGGRLGVFVLDMGNGEYAGHRADERFPMCSTFKFLLVTNVLRRVGQHEESLQRPVEIPPKPLLFNSPLTEPHAGETMPIGNLCFATLTRSDNTAANLLLRTVDGPDGLTTFVRSIGDGVTRLDRWETALNESRAGDPRDTTSPIAMASDLRAVLLGNVLSLENRRQLTTWMEANLTGIDRLRSGLPEGWRAADKTGSNGEHTSNDIAVWWPVGRAPVVITAYVTQCPGPESKRAAMLAEIGQLVRQVLV